jgi:cytochrome bd-type quinol oxidase subunit 2
MLFPTLTVGLALFLFLFLFGLAITLPLMLAYTPHAFWVLRGKVSESDGYDEG